MVQTQEWTLCCLLILRSLNQVFYRMTLQLPCQWYLVLQHVTHTHTHTHTHTRWQLNLLHLHIGLEWTIYFSCTSSTATDCTNTTAGDFCLIRNNATFDLGSGNSWPHLCSQWCFDDFLVEGRESFTVSASITDPGMQGGGVTPAFVPGTDTGTINIIDNDRK